MPDQTKFQHEGVYQLLRLRFIRQNARFEISLDVHVEERVDATERDGRAVVFLHRGEIAKVRPLHAFLGRLRRRADVESVHRRHTLQSIQRLDLLRHLESMTNRLLAHRSDRLLILPLSRRQRVDAEQRDPSVISDESSSTVRVR